MVNLTNVCRWIGSIAFKAGHKSEPSPRIVGECDSRSITAWIRFHFSFSVTARSRSKATRGSKPLALPQKDINVHKYRRQYMWHAQIALSHSQAGHILIPPHNLNTPGHLYTLPSYLPATQTWSERPSNSSCHGYASAAACCLVCSFQNKRHVQHLLRVKYVEQLSTTHPESVPKVGHDPPVDNYRPLPISHTAENALMNILNRGHVGLHHRHRWC